MAIQNFFTSRENSADASTFVGQEGRLWYNIDDNIIYASDGTTPGGIAVTSGSPGGYGDANVVVLLSNNFGSNTIVTTGNITAGNLLTNSIVSSAGNIVIDGNLIPVANTYSLGSVTDPWEDAFFGPQSITIQDSTGNVDLSVIIENSAGNITIDSAGFEIRTLATEIPVFRIEALTGQVFSNALTIIENNTNASNTTSGSLQTAGGSGIAQDLYVGGSIHGSLSEVLSAGSYITATGAYDGGTARTFAVDATTTNTASKVVARDANGTIAATNTVYATREAGSFGTGQTLTIDFATDRFVHATITGEPVTVAYTNITLGKEVYIFFTNSSGGDLQVNSGVSNQNATNAKAVENTKNGGTSQIRVTSFGTTVNDLYVHFKK